MSDERKSAETLGVRDFERFPIWEYTNEHEHISECMVRPVFAVCVDSVVGRIIGAPVLLANCKQIWASFENVDEQSAVSTRHFLSISVYCDDSSFTLARYHDFDYLSRGPVALASFLGLSATDVFPIRFDVSRFCTLASEALAGVIEAEPQDQLTESELLKLTLRLR